MTSRHSYDVNTKKRTIENVVFLPDDSDDGIGDILVIDKGDYRITSQILFHWRDLCQYYGDVTAPVRKRVKVQENDEEGRVHELNLKGYSSNRKSIPKCIGQLTHLSYLTLQHSSITSLPPTIGQFRNLKGLFLDCTCLLQLPDEIGDLASLTELSLSWSSISSLPHSIGRLQNLERLNLYHTKNLNVLPEEIGDLASLIELGLSGSKISSLPPTIGRLKRLRRLVLARTDNLLGLPAEIGDLVSLKELSLDQSSIEKLPPSFGRLRSLEKLDLTDSGVTSLPKAIGNLTKLTTIYLYGTPMYNDEYLLPLIRRCQSLCFLQILGAESAKTTYALDCNHARLRTGFGAGAARNASSVALAPELWPRLLDKAERPFLRDVCIEKRCSKPDCIYQLLEDGRESFLEILIHRH